MSTPAWSSFWLSSSSSVAALYCPREFGVAARNWFACWEEAAPGYAPNEGPSEGAGEDEGYAYEAPEYGEALYGERGFFLSFEGDALRL